MSAPVSRNQLWFMYVFTSAREQFEAGPQQQADAMQNTVSQRQTRTMAAEEEEEGTGDAKEGRTIHRLACC